jgi:hypothetical protein
MATLRITNLDTAPLYIADIYNTIAVSGYVDVERAASDIPRMKALITAISAGQASLLVTYSAAELASGLMAPPQSVEAGDVAPVAAAAVPSGAVLFRKSFAAGGGGSPADVTLFAANALPFKFRVMDSWVFIATAVAGTATLYDEAAGAGTAVAAGATTATGRVTLDPDSDASVVLSPGATKGLFLRLSDDAAAGEVFVLVRPES